MNTNNSNTTTDTHNIPFGGEVLDFLDKHDACEEGRTFALQFPTMAEVWDACTNMDWMWWIIERAEVAISDKDLRLFACWCVRNTPLADGKRTVLDLLTDERSRSAVEVSERFANGEATREELGAAWDAAWGAAWGAARDAAQGAAWDAAWGAARGAAWGAQCNHLRTIVSNPFKQQAINE